MKKIIFIIIMITLVSACAINGEQDYYKKKKFLFDYVSDHDSNFGEVIDQISNFTDIRYPITDEDISKFTNILTKDSLAQDPNIVEIALYRPPNCEANEEISHNDKYRVFSFKDEKIIDIDIYTDRGSNVSNGEEYGMLSVHIARVLTENKLYKYTVYCVRKKMFKDGTCVEAFTIIDVEDYLLNKIKKKHFISFHITKENMDKYLFY